MNTVRESALKADSGGENPLPNRGIEPATVLIIIMIITVIIIIMENCQALTPRLNMMNKHNTAHIMYIKIENVLRNLTES